MGRVGEVGLSALASRFGLRAGLGAVVCPVFAPAFRCDRRRPRSIQLVPFVPVSCARWSSRRLGWAMRAKARKVGTGGLERRQAPCGGGTHAFGAEPESSRTHGGSCAPGLGCVRSGRTGSRSRIFLRASTAASSVAGTPLTSSPSPSTSKAYQVGAHVSPRDRGPDGLRFGLAHQKRPCAVPGDDRDHRRIRMAFNLCHFTLCFLHGLFSRVVSASARRLALSGSVSAEVSVLSPCSSAQRMAMVSLFVASWVRPPTRSDGGISVLD